MAPYTPMHTLIFDSRPEARRIPLSFLQFSLSRALAPQVPEKFIDSILDAGKTFTGSLFQITDICQFDFTVTVPDDLFIVQGCQRLADRGSLHSELFSEEIMGEGKHRTSGAMLIGEKPSAEPLFHGMKLTTADRDDGFAENSTTESNQRVPQERNTVK